MKTRTTCELEGVDCELFAAIVLGYDPRRSSSSETVSYTSHTVSDTPGTFASKKPHRNATFASFGSDRIKVGLGEVLDSQQQKVPHFLVVPLDGRWRVRGTWIWGAGWVSVWFRLDLGRFERSFDHFVDLQHHFVLHGSSAQLCGGFQWPSSPDFHSPVGSLFSFGSRPPRASLLPHPREALFSSGHNSLFSGHA